LSGQKHGDEQKKVKYFFHVIKVELRLKLQFI
jgi:hypothetical protein